MANQNDSGFKAFLTAEALGAYRLVRFDSSGYLVYADAEESPIGVTQMDAASGVFCTVKLLSAPGTFKIATAAAITFAVTTDERGPLLYVANDGYVTPTAGTKVFFNACEAGDGAGAVVECTPYNIPN